jgi:hypothetical protein
VNTAIYVSPKLLKLLKGAMFITSDRLADHELVLVNTDSAVEAVLDNKNQIPTERACVTFSTKEDSIKKFFKGTEEGAVTDRSSVSAPSSRTKVSLFPKESSLPDVDGG